MSIPLDVLASESINIAIAEFVADAAYIQHSRQNLLRKIVREVVVPSIRQNFLAGGRPEHWEPITQDTLERKKNPEKGVLRDTDNLKNAMALQGNWNFTRETAELDHIQGADYGVFHQIGTQFMPAREFALLQNEDLERIEHVAGEWMGVRGYV
jgi:phage gpG-like protein